MFDGRGCLIDEQAAHSLHELLEAFGQWIDRVG